MRIGSAGELRLRQRSAVHLSVWVQRKALDQDYVGRYHVGRQATTEIAAQRRCAESRCGYRKRAATFSRRRRPCPRQDKIEAEINFGFVTSCCDVHKTGSFKRADPAR